MRKITLYVGLNDQETKTQLINTLDAYRIVTNILGVDSTITEAKGIYTHEDGTITSENTLTVMLLDFDNVMSKAWLMDKINAIKVALNQESVAVAAENIESELM